MNNQSSHDQAIELTQKILKRLGNDLPYPLRLKAIFLIYSALKDGLEQFEKHAGYENQSIGPVRASNN